MHDFNAPRLFVKACLAAGREITLDFRQSHYLVTVLRVSPGRAILVFNGSDGEWRALVRMADRRDAVLVAENCVRPQESGLDLDYLFAPLKRNRLDYLVQKAVEMGVARLQPILTRRTVAERVNLDRMRANVVEAAEQCGILRIPEVLEPVPLERLIAAWDPVRRLVYCDEQAAVRDPIAALKGLPLIARSGEGAREDHAPYAVLVGPEGGFPPEERERLSGVAAAAISLGPRIMRADTAAVAALALLNAVLGDWRG